MLLCYDSNRHQKSMEGILEFGSGGQCQLGGRPHNPATWFHVCSCGETQTMSRIVESCPLMKLNGGLSQLHSADDAAIAWLPGL